MRFLRFDAGKGPRLGLLAGSRVIDLAAAAPGESAARWLSPDTARLIEGGARAIDLARRISGAAPSPAAVHDPAAIRWLPPVSTPGKIVAVGQNYMDHVREQKVEPPKVPVLFSKAPTSVIGPGDEIRWPDGLTGKVDPEVELGVVIGVPTRGVDAEAALRRVFGYTILNDVSARDLQFSDQQWVRGKSLDTFCPLGPVLVTADEIPDPQALRLSLAVNGRTWQDSSTSEMIFPVRELMEFISRGITLLPGDLIATGTPNGVGYFQKPPAFLQPGDKLRLEIEAIGVLENTVGRPY